MSTEAWIGLVGALLTVIGSLIVVLLAYLHVRLNRIDLKNDQRTDRLYDHLDANYVRRDTHEAHRDSLMRQLQGINSRFDSVMNLLSTLASSNSNDSKETPKP